jgi:hypothetical protein
MDKVKDLVKVDRLFSDTDEGVNVLYNERGEDVAAFLWVVDDNYGSVSGRLVTLFGCGWDEMTEIRLILSDWSGKGRMTIDDKEIGEFDNLDEGERLATAKFESFMREGLYVRK